MIQVNDPSLDSQQSNRLEVFIIFRFHMVLAQPACCISH